jgi:hypothetical protein
MNSEKELINQIRKLNQIKPDTNWVALTKVRVMGQETMGQRQSWMSLVSGFIFQYRTAFAGILMVGLVGGTLVESQNALPGEPLYSVKRATETGMALITGQDKMPAANLQLAAKRLEEIDLISQKNLVKDLPAAFYEYKTAKAAAKKEVAALVAKNPDNAGAIVKESSVAMKDIDNKEKQVYAVLGLEKSASTTEDGTEAASDKTIVESLINYFKKDALLSEDETKDLDQVNKLYRAGNYGEAVDYYLNSSLNK